LFTVVSSINLTLPDVKTQKLGSADIAWLRMEDPTNPMTIVGLLVFSEPVSIDTIRHLLRERLLIFERFRQKIDMSGDPSWVTDPDFVIEAHVHRAGLPPPGDKEALEEFVGDLMSSPLDLTKAPWQMHLVEDYNGGAVLVARLHHCLGDGIALVHVLLSMADEYFEGFDLSTIPSYGKEKEDLTFVESLVRPVSKTVSGLGRTAGGLLGHAFGIIQKPGKVFDWAKTGMSAAAAASRIALLASDTPTRLKGKVGVLKRVAWSDPIPLADVKSVCVSTGAKVNDVLLSSVAGGLRRYLLAHGDPVADVEIGSVIPVNIRPIERAFDLGNCFGLVFLFLPVGIADPRERLSEVRARMAMIKASAEPAVAFTILQAIGAGPMTLHREVTDLLSSRTSAVMTNVPGPQRQLHMGGYPISGLMFWVPRAGSVGLGVSIISYNGTVRLGVATDARLAPDPQAIVAGLHAEFYELKAAFDGDGPRRPGKKKNQA
jgi:diacylglycerol O-acyltransferase / wax synthase